MNKKQSDPAVAAISYSNQQASRGLLPLRWRLAALVVSILFFLYLLWQAHQRVAEQANLSWALPQDFPQALIDWPQKAKQPIHFQTTPIQQDAAAHIHAATAVARADGIVHVFWYGGTREGAKDVQVFHSRWDPTSAIWSDATAIMSPEKLSKDLNRYIKKIGNPLAINLENGDLWLVFVSVSVGGWAGSQLNWMSSSDDGETWSEPNRWVTSPFLNISTLVKSPALSYEQGWLGIPIYHEFIGKFSEYLLVKPSGQIFNKVRMDWGRDNLQPVVLPTSGRAASAYMRFAGGEPNRVLISGSADAGLSWRSPATTSLPNPDAAVAGLTLSEQEQLLVFNNSPVDRRVLSLAYSKDQGEYWSVIHDFERVSQQSSGAFSYPVLLKAGEFYHLFYSFNRQYIKHVRFNDAWLADKILAGAADASMNP